MGCEALVGDVTRAGGDAAEPMARTNELGESVSHVLERTNSESPSPMGSMVTTLGSVVTQP